MDVDRKTLTGLLLVLFLFASWSIGVVMTTSPTVSPGDTDFTSAAGYAGYARPILVALLIIVFASLYMKGRTPTFLVIALFLVAMMGGAYLIFLIGFSWSLLMILFVIIISAIAIWRGVTDEHMSPYLAGVVVVGAVLFAVVMLGGGMEMISEEIAADGEPPSLPWDDPTGDIERGFGSIGNFVLLLLIGGILGFLIVQKMIPIIRSTKKETEKGMEDQLSSTVEKAVTELREGKDVHSTILRCYQRMCLILEEEGAKNFEFMTPREFEKQALTTLDIKTPTVSEIRKVFEMAKYSNYRLGEEERDRAVKALKELRKELS